VTTSLLITKLYIPPVRPELVSRPRLIERLDAGLYRKLTLISAPAGFGKTTLVSAWTHLSRRAAAGERGPLHCVRRMNDNGSHAKRGARSRRRSGKRPRQPRPRREGGPPWVR